MWIVEHYSQMENNTKKMNRNYISLPTFKNLKFSFNLDTHYNWVNILSSVIISEVTILKYKTQCVWIYQLFQRGGLAVKNSLSA